MTVGLVYRVDFTAPFQFFKGKGPLVDMQGVY